MEEVKDVQVAPAGTSGLEAVPVVVHHFQCLLEILETLQRYMI